MNELRDSKGKPALKLTPIQWLICIIAVIGFAFDTYEILMLPLIAPPALVELTGAQPGSPVFQMWAARLFYVPAFAAGIFGLLGGYLTDLFGRRRVLTFSILLYALGAFASGFSTSVVMLLALRCLVFIGVSVEFVAAVAWLAELFSDPAQRERVIGYTQMCSSFGGLMVGTANGLCVAYSSSLPDISAFGLAITNPNAAWRYTLMTGVIPAIPLILIRPFLPESPIWREKRAAGTLKRPSLFAIFSPELRRTTVVTTIMVAMAYGAAFGAIQQVPTIVRGHAQMQELTQGQTPARVDEIRQHVASRLTVFQETGGLVGRFLLALLVARVISRRRIVWMYQIPALVVIPIVFGIVAPRSLDWLYVGAWLSSFLIVGQFSFWGNYLPRVFPVHLRGTGESFAANIGGRLIGTCFAYVTLTLATVSESSLLFPSIKHASTKLAIVAAVVGFSVCLAGFIASFWLPEPKREELPE